MVVRRYAADKVELFSGFSSSPDREYMEKNKEVLPAKRIDTI